MNITNMDLASRDKVHQEEKPVILDQAIAFWPSSMASPWMLLILAILATVIYSNAFSVPFQLDDFYNIVENQRMKNLTNLLDLAGTRYLAFFSFAMNYQFGGLSVVGYHLVNLGIHITNSVLVYWLVQLLSRTPGIALAAGARPGQPAWIALETASLFVVHPIQTQAVTYIFQRVTSLATLFYLLAVFSYLRWRLTTVGVRSRPAWYGVALLATVLAMKTKEISFTLPVMLLLVEAVTFGPITRSRWVSLSPFLLTLVIIPLSTIDALAGQHPGLARETAEITRSAYLFTQFRVIVTYIRLLVLPMNQRWDYDYPIYHSLTDPPVLASLLFLGALLGLALALLYRAPRATSNRGRYRLVAFGILWFFLTLSIESSIIPIRDVIFEHRLYLPSVGGFLAFSTLAAMGWEAVAGRVLEKILVGALVLILLSLSVATYQRNAVWKDPVSLWEDVVRKTPKKARGHNNLGFLYATQGRWDEAIREYQAAVMLRPDFTEAHSNLGWAYSTQGRWDEAIREYQAALTFESGYPDVNADVHLNLGNIYAKLGRWDEAIRGYQAALELQPNLARAHYNLATVYQHTGRTNEAIKELERTLQVQPDLLAARQALETLSH